MPVLGSLPRIWQRLRRPPRSCCRRLDGRVLTIHPPGSRTFCAACSLITEWTMQISRLRQKLQDHLAAFAWSQWGQMGVLAPSDRADEWVADPEALLLLTLEVCREEPRLFDEVLDWLLVNERLVSLHRLRNLAVDDDDRALAGAVIEWLGKWRRKSPPPPQVEPD